MTWRHRSLMRAGVFAFIGLMGAMLYLALRATSAGDIDPHAATHSFAAPAGLGQ